ncbi:hypothetical protein BKI52_02645 [marine bacterium AO1-C]|nr:hypothetical protein BKI52_02645 [marine bacterium AO1-C]
MTDKQKQAIGVFLGIALMGTLIWYLFFGGKSKVKITNPLRRVPQGGSKSTTPSTSSGSSGSTVSYNNSGGGGSYTPKLPNGNYFPIQPGSRGQAVKWLQEALKESGHHPGAIDGVWGTKTTAAFRMAFPYDSTYIREADWEPFMKVLFPNSYQDWL